MSDEKLGDRIVEFIRAKNQQYREQWTDDGLNPLRYSAAFEVNYIADELKVSRMAVNGALAQLHEKKRVLGYHVVGNDTESYAIALSEP